MARWQSFLGAVPALEGWNFGTGRRSRVIIGTAGHVDHGKTTLVRALTGQDTDRLPEEKARGISIDLGFAEFTLPSGRRAGVVDVPGHERFIRNMVAGAAGMDLVLLVVAADEGVMPQTREHMDILQLLGVASGLVALTKKDLVDPEWLGLVADEVREALAGTFLEGAPVIPVSGVTGEGLDELKAAVDRLLAEARPRPGGGPARLPVDRAFSVAGAGTVVTGTLLSGSIAPEDRLELLPAGLAVRVRGVQVHGRRVERAIAGQRTAVNIVGADRNQVRRGDVLAQPGALRPTRTFAARLRLLTGARPLENEARVHLHTGTAEVLGRVLLLDRDRLEPGGSSFVQFKAEEPLVVARGDRYIVRSYSPVTTVGGGVVLDAARRYKRFNPSGLQDLARLETGSPRDLLAAVIQEGRPLAVGDVVRRAGLPWDALRPEAEALVESGGAVWLGARDWLFSAAGYARLRERLAAFLASFHDRYPLRGGAPREEVRTALWPDLDVRASNALLQRLQEDGAVVLEPDRVALAGYDALPTEAAAACRRVEAAYRDAGLSPPAVSEVAPLAGADREGAGLEEVLRRLVADGALVKLGGDLYFHREALAEAADRVRAYLQEHGTMTVAQMRDLLGTTRRYAVPLAEHFDRVRLTRRVGDERRLA